MKKNKSVFLILFIVFVLNGVGLVVLSSVSQPVAGGTYLKKQFFSVIIAALSCFFFAKIPLRHLVKSQKTLFICALVGLVSVLVPGIGKVINGSRRWIQIPGFSLQVSEFAKIPLIIWLAGYIREYESYRHQFMKGFLTPVLVCSGLVFFVLCEPDYGTAFLMMGVVLVVLFLSGVRLGHIFSFIAFGALAFGGLILLSPVRLQRVTSFFNIEGHRFDATYQLWQGILCFASGGMQGVGVGLGRQKLSYLPEAHTDFIFPIIGEEFGGIFAILIVFSFLVLALTALLAIYPKEDIFVRALGSGAALIIAFQAIINIGVVTGCMPTKGMALPFISYGGSNLVAMYSLIGLIINCISTQNVSERPIKSYSRSVALV